MVLDWLLKRNKDTGQQELKKILAHGILTGDSQRPQTVQEQMMQLGINRETIKDDDIIQLINELIKLCAKENTLDFHLFALRNLVTQLLRTSRLDRIDAYILTLQAQQILMDIEANMPNELVELGVLNYLDTINIILESAFCDAIGGWKAKLLKVSPKYFEVTMPSEKKTEPWMGK